MFQRNFLRGAMDVEMDANGRILVPKTLTKFASIEKEVILVGVGNRLEIWNPAQYEEYLISDENEFADLAEKYLGEAE